MANRIPRFTLLYKVSTVQLAQHRFDFNSAFEPKQYRVLKSPALFLLRYSEHNFENFCSKSLRRTEHDSGDLKPVVRQLIIHILTRRKTKNRPLKIRQMVRRIRGSDINRVSSFLHSDELVLSGNTADILKY